MTKDERIALYEEEITYDGIEDAEQHFAKAMKYLTLAEQDMVRLIRGGGAATTPPHALAFANAHLQAAEFLRMPYEEWVPDADREH